MLQLWILNYALAGMHQQYSGNSSEIIHVMMYVISYMSDIHDDELI